MRDVGAGSPPDFSHDGPGLAANCYLHAGPGAVVPAALPLWSEPVAAYSAMDAHSGSGGRSELWTGRNFVPVRLEQSVLCALGTGGRRDSYGDSDGGGDLSAGADRDCVAAAAGCDAVVSGDCGNSRRAGCGVEKYLRPGEPVYAL